MTAGLGVLAASAALGLAAPPAAAAVPPPTPGAWRELGRTVSSLPGKQVHLFRIATPYPTRLAVVAVSSSGQPIRLHWYSYCEFLSDDDTFEEHSQTISGLHGVVGYPPVFDGATLCYVSLYATAGPGAVVDAAVFTG